jgi:hypothetical protein
MDQTVLVIFGVVAVVVIVALLRFGRDRSRRVGYSVNKPARKHWKAAHADRHHGSGASSTAGGAGPRRFSRAAEETPTARSGGAGLLSEADLAEVETLLARRRKIEAIKLVRERTGMGLKDAKEFVEHRAGGGSQRSGNPWGHRR